MIRRVTRAGRLLGRLEERLGQDRNYALGVLNGWLVFVGDGFMNAQVVLSSFAAALAAPNLVIGLLPAIQVGGWLLPQLLVASRVRHLPRKIVVYRSAATLRTLAYLWMAGSSALFAGRPGLLLAMFVLGMILSGLSAGVAGLPFMEVVAKVIPARARSGFFGIRNVVGGLLALGAGLAVRQILASEIPFPYDYTLIFVLGLSFYSAGYWVFGLVDEPPDPPAERGRFRDELRALPATVRDDPPFRAYVALRLTLAAAGLADPFYTVYALRELGVAQATIGSFLIVLGVVGPLSNAGWARLGQRFGSRRVLRVAIPLAMLAPLAALAMPRGAGPAFALVFALFAAGQAGLNLGNLNHMLGIAPTETRGRYIGLVHTLLGVAAFAPVVGGRLADAVGYAPVFALGSSLYAAAWLVAGRLRHDV